MIKPVDIRTLTKKLKKDANYMAAGLSFFRLAKEAMSPQKGKVYMAPGNRHMIIDSQALSMKLWDGPKENLVRSAAGPLFRSAADIFESYCVA
ncbi:MAG: chemotaxis protein CheB [Nitrospinales bacterium]